MGTTFKINNFGGYQYLDPESKRRAKAADLITVPFVRGDVDHCGALCVNCQFFSANHGDGSGMSGLCFEKRVKLPVTVTMCCSFWKNPAQLDSWVDM